VSGIIERTGDDDIGPQPSLRFPSPPHRCSICERLPHDQDESAWDIRFSGDRDEHVLLLLCPQCAALSPREPLWKRALRCVWPEGPPTYHSL